MGNKIIFEGQSRKQLRFHEVNAILRMYFVRRWAVDKRWLLAELIDITPSYGHNF